MMQQMNISYSPTQDRLLLKVNRDNTAEYRIWMTRRFTSLLVNLLKDQMNEAGGHQKLATSNETVTQLKSGAFEKEYQNTNPVELPLGADGILAYRINLKKLENDGLGLQLLPEEGTGMNINLDKSMVYMLFNLIEQAINHPNWNLDPVQMARNLLH